MPRIITELEVKRKTKGLPIPIKKVRLTRFVDPKIKDSVNKIPRRVSNLTSSSLTFNDISGKPDLKNISENALKSAKTTQEQLQALQALNTIKTAEKTGQLTSLTANMSDSQKQQFDDLLEETKYNNRSNLAGLYEIYKMLKQQNNLNKTNLLVDEGGAPAEQLDYDVPVDVEDFKQKIEEVVTAEKEKEQSEKSNLMTLIDEIKSEDAKEPNIDKRISNFKDLPSDEIQTGINALSNLKNINEQNINKIFEGVQGRVRQFRTSADVTLSPTLAVSSVKQRITPATKNRDGYYFPLMNTFVPDNKISNFMTAYGIDDNFVTAYAVPKMSKMDLLKLKK